MTDFQSFIYEVFMCSLLQLRACFVQRHRGNSLTANLFPSVSGKSLPPSITFLERV